MRDIDLSASNEAFIPSILLMENAALACVNFIKTLNVHRIGIFCGKGNNGGDGFAIARQLIRLGYDVHVFLVLDTAFSGDALINYNILKNTNAKITAITDTELLEYYISASDLTVDAIFGTGIHGEIGGMAREVITAINNYSKAILSVDIPSGVNADTGEVLSVAVKADYTVTFAAYKLGMFLYPGADYTGEIYISDISIPDYIIEKSPSDIYLTDSAYAKKLLPERKNNSHKGDYGKVFILGGSIGMTGAVALSSQSSLVSGAGLVTLGIPKSLNSVMEVKLTEVMTYPLPEISGMLSDDAYTLVSEKINSSDILLFGPGIGRNESTQKLLFKILKNSQIPIIIDADGLYLLSEHLDILSSCNSNLILTPHEMEFARLLNKNIDEVRANRLELSKEFATQYGVTLVLKGHHTIATAPDGRQYINPTGNPGMATGGSGDVLAGMIAAFAASLPDETNAAVLSVYIHGLAGDIALENSNEISLTAQDIANNIKNAISNISTGKISNFMIK